jgi:hypothetical protein
MRAPARQPQRPVENGESGHAHGAAMPRRRASVMAVPLLIGPGLLLSACMINVDSPRPIYGHGFPYGSLDSVGWR